MCFISTKLQVYFISCVFALHCTKTSLQCYSARVCLRSKSVRMSTWKLQMAAVVIVRTELTICKLNTRLYSDFSTELLYWCDAVISRNSWRHILCTFLSVLSVFSVYKVCHANGVSWNYRRSHRLFWIVSMRKWSELLWSIVLNWIVHKVFSQSCHLMTNSGAWRGNNLRKFHAVTELNTPNISKWLLLFAMYELCVTGT